MKKNKRKLSVLILIFILFMGILLLILLSSILPRSTASFLQINKQLVDQAAKNREIFNKISKEYPDQIPVSIINNYYDSVGPNGLLDIIGQDDRCHNQGHNIGRVIYQKTKDLEQSLLICSDSCSWGCSHGVLAEVFESKIKQSGLSPSDHVSVEQVKAIMADICDEAANLSDEESSLCPHGLGHALLGLSEGDLRTALSYCDNFKTQTKIFYCASGVYMQYFIDKKTETDVQLTRHPCSDFSFPAACYHYLFVWYPIQIPYQDVTKFCQGIPDIGERHGCFSGLGYVFSRRVQDGLILLDDLCREGDSIDRKLCIEGAIEVVNAYDPNIARSICAQLSSQSKVFCQDEIAYGWSKRNTADYFVRK